MHDNERLETEVEGLKPAARELQDLKDTLKRYPGATVTRDMKTGRWIVTPVPVSSPHRNVVRKVTPPVKVQYQPASCTISGNLGETSTPCQLDPANCDGELEQGRPYDGVIRSGGDYESFKENLQTKKMPPFVQLMQALRLDEKNIDIFLQPQNTGEVWIYGPEKVQEGTFLDYDFSNSRAPSKYRMRIGVIDPSGNIRTSMLDGLYSMNMR